MYSETRTFSNNHHTAIFIWGSLRKSLEVFQEWQIWWDNCLINKTLPELRKSLLNRQKTLVGKSKSMSLGVVNEGSWHQRVWQADNVVAGGPGLPSLNGLWAGPHCCLPPSIATVCRPGPGPAIQFNCHLPPELPIKFQRYSKFRPCHARLVRPASTILE